MAGVARATPATDNSPSPLYRPGRGAYDLAAAWPAPEVDGLVGLLADLRRDADADAAFRAMGARRDQPLVNALARGRAVR